MDLNRPDTCAWCESELIVGRQPDTGRPLTGEESAAGFFACHVECRERMDGFFAGLASRGVFVDVSVTDGNPEHGGEDDR